MCDASACTSDYDDCYADGTYEAQTCKDGFMPVPLGSSEYTCCFDSRPRPPPSPPSPPSPPTPPPLPTTPYYNATIYSDSYCYSPANEWVVHDVPTSAAEADSTCDSPLGTWSQLGEWCDFSGWRPMLQGTLFPGSSDCSTAQEAFGGYYGDGFAADGSCVYNSDGTSSRYHCV